MYWMFLTALLANLGTRNVDAAGRLNNAKG